MKIKYELAQMFEADPNWSAGKTLRYADELGRLDNRSMIKIITLFAAKIEGLEEENEKITQLVSEMSENKPKPKKR